jgi:putative copper export protein
MHSALLAIHILAACVWTGGHLVLAFTVLPRALRADDPRILLDFEQGYERIGMPALVLQVLSGLWLAHELVTPGAWLSFAGVQETGIAVKLGLLAATVGFALNARFRLIPRLDARRLRVLAWHIRAVTLLSVLFVLTGVYLRTGGF